MQSLENPYVLGKNTVECDVMGVPCTMELEVIESPVESIEFDKLTLRYGTDGTFKYKNGRKWFQYEYEPTYTVKMIWESLYDLVSGRYGVEAVSGPIGVTEALTEAADTGVYSFTYLAVVISINLGVMNLLPFPALDGGRIVFLLIEAIRRKPLKKEIEAYINFAGLALLMILMVLICTKDIIGLF
jgi:regulator of sigma E protease